MNDEDRLEKPLLQARAANATTYRSTNEASASNVVTAAARFVRKRHESESSFEKDYVSIELPPLNESETLADNVGTALDKCKKYVLERYRFLLKLLGWLPWMSDKAEQYKPIRLWNLVYPVLLVGMLVLGYILGIASCWSRSRLFDVEQNRTGMNCSSQYNPLKPCSNLWTTYVWLDILQLVSYIYAIDIFRRRKNGDLETVMEKTFIKTPISGDFSQGKLTRKLRIILYLGIAWALIQLVTNISVVVVRILDCQVTPKGRIGFSSWIAEGAELSLLQMYALIVLMLIGVFSMDMVYVAVAVNYGAQCELLIFYIRGLNQQINEKSITLQEAMREYKTAGNYIDSLGRQMAIAMSLIEVIVVVQALVSFISLYDVKEITEGRAIEVQFLIVGVVYVLIWTSFAMFVLFQAAKLNSACSATVLESLDVCLFGYQNASQIEINLFVVFMTSQSQQRAAKLFYLPIYIGHLCGVVAAAFTVFLALSELNIITFTIHL
ncbi:uncharacterized protein LOC134177068 [Corticium candelabrum]|uniref:uncharacterized protein LOC134177068 n=1 Tax=Corticium candelabrum TaxID=121492 RepID=UPI002E263617|nr:uncharacterized protein LOC134177068 [Corticium candelabrum]